jgi:hypothetical protein
VFLGYRSRYKTLHRSLVMLSFTKVLSLSPNYQIKIPNLRITLILILADVMSRTYSRAFAYRVHELVMALAVELFSPKTDANPTIVLSICMGMHRWAGATMLGQVRSSSPSRPLPLHTCLLTPTRPLLHRYCSGPITPRWVELFMGNTDPASTRPLDYTPKLSLISHAPIRPMKRF